MTFGAFWKNLVIIRARVDQTVLRFDKIREEKPKKFDIPGQDERRIIKKNVVLRGIDVTEEIIDAIPGLSQQSFSTVVLLYLC